MDPSFPSYHFTLAQMPTDQRERERPLAVQTEVSGAEGILPVNASRSCHPCPPGQSWSTFRSNLTPGSMIHYRGPGFTSDAWDATMSEPYEFSSAQLPRDLVPGDIDSSPFYSTPQAPVSSTIASTTSMTPQSSPLYVKHMGNDDDFMNWPTGPITPSFVPHGTLYPYPAQMETSETKSVATRTTSPSPAISISSQQSPSRSFDSMSPAASATAADPTSPQTSFGDNSDQDVSTEPPYSKLIYDALMSTPEKMMPLQEIYAWFERNTSKGKDKNKGWQNSIRHNLSMNAVRALLSLLIITVIVVLMLHVHAIREAPLTQTAFQGFEAFRREESGKKPINYWRLTDEAKAHGVQSTTRYRKANHRKLLSSDPPALGRQRSGSKGGRAARNAAKVRHANQEEQRRERNLQSTSLHHFRQPHSQMSLEQPVVQPVLPVFPPPSHYQPQDPFDHQPIPSGLPVVPRDDYIQTFSVGNTIDITCLPPGENAVFCDTAGPNPDAPAFDMGQLDWYRLASGLNSGWMTGSNGL